MGTGCLYLFIYAAAAAFIAPAVIKGLWAARRP